MDGGEREEERRRTSVRGTTGGEGSRSEAQSSFWSDGWEFGMTRHGLWPRRLRGARTMGQQTERVRERGHVADGAARDVAK